MGLGDMHNFHHFGALLVLLKSTVASFVKHTEDTFCIAANLGKFCLI